MPGLCGVIEIVRHAAGADDEPSALLLERMSSALCHFSPDTVLYRTALGPFHVAVVGYPSTVWRPILAEDADGISEVWFGEVHDGRPTCPSGSPGAAGRFVDSVGTASSLGAQLARMSGSFVGIRLNRSTGEFDLFNDVLGTIPLYLRRVGGRLLFAPESKALLEAGNADVRGDGRALAFYLSMGYLPPGRTHLREIRGLSPASVLSGRAGGTSWSAPTSRRYWDYGFSDHVEDRGRDHYMKGIEERLAETVGSQVHSGERIGICLSGGHDSRGVLAAIPPTRAHLESVTWGWNPEADGCDAQVARQVAERAGLTHRFLPLDPEALPRHASDWVWITDGALEGVYNYPQGADIFRGLATEFDVLIRGDQSFVKWPYGVPDDRVAQAAIGVYPFEWHGIYDALIRPEPLVQLNVAGRRVHEEISARLRSHHPLDRKDEYFYEVHLFAKMNALNYLKSLAIPIRNPLIDRRFLELVQTFPRTLRRGKGLYRTVIATRFPQFGDVPFAHRTNLIPWQEVSGRSGELKRFFQGSLLEARGGFSDLIDRVRLEERLTKWFRPASTAKAPASRKRPWAERAKTVAYLPLTPRVVRNVIVPPRSRRAAFEYLFRLLVLALYLERLEGRGIRLSWDWESGDTPWIEAPRCR